MERKLRNLKVFLIGLLFVFMVSSPIIFAEGMDDTETIGSKEFSTIAAPSTSNSSAPNEEDNYTVRNGVLTLLGNVTINGPLIITSKSSDLGGQPITRINLGSYSITRTLSANDNYPFVIWYAPSNGSSSLTITGNSGSIILNGTYSGVCSALLVYSGNVNVNNVNIETNVQSNTNYAAVQVGSMGGQQANASLTIGGGSSIKNNNSITGTGIVAVSNNQTGSNFSTTLNVNNCSITAEAFGISTNGTKGQKTVSINIGQNNSNPTITGKSAGMYLPNSQGNVTINSGNISGESGIIIAGGLLDIPGNPIITGNGEAGTNNNATIGSANPTGAGIQIEQKGQEGTTGDGTGYGNTKVNVTGNASINSVKGNAVQTTSNGNSATGLSEVNLENGTYTSPTGTPSVSFSNNTPNTAVDDAINGGSYSDSSNLGPYIDPDMTNSAQSGASNGQTYTTYGSSQADVEAGVDALKVNLNKQNIAITTPPVYSYEFPPGTNPDPQITKSIFNVSLGDDLLNYTNYTNNATQQEQSNNIGLNIQYSGTPIAANALNWSITSLNNSNNPIITFENDWVWKSYPDGSSQPAIQTTSNDGAWTLVHQVNPSLKNGNPQNSTTGDGGVILTSVGQAFLLYNGTGDIDPGIYQLTATVQSDAYAGTASNPPSDSIRLTISESTITGVTLTQNGVIAPNYQTVDIQTTPTEQFSYTTTPANAYPGSNVKWNIQLMNDSVDVGSYASVSNTGLVRFRRPTPENNPLRLWVTVDGINSNSVVITTTGETPSTEVTELGVYQDQIYLPAGTTYSLADNVCIMPDYIPFESDQLTNLSFTSEGNNNVIIYNGSILPVNTNYTGSVEVTATYKNEDGSLSNPVTYTINYVSKAVPATGITAVESMSLNLSDDQSQNVMARLTPENTTTQLNPSQVTYTSGNDAIAYVDTNGNVYPNGVGTTTITSTLPSSTELSGTNPSRSATTTVTVTEEPSDIPATAISVTPTQLYLTTKEGGTTQGEVTVTLTPADSTDEITYESTAPTVATVTPGTTPGTYVIKAEADGITNIVFKAGDVNSEPVMVIVSSQDYIADGIYANGTTPDNFTVSVNNVHPNPALTGITGTVEGVSIFTWSGPDQNDMQCKYVDTLDSDGMYSYSPFTVNGNDYHTFYYNADNIYVSVYARVSGRDIYLGSNSMGNYSWVYSGTAGDNSVAYITYQQNIGFNTPTKFDQQISGVTGQNLQLEGLRVSSNIEGVKVVTDVHEQNVGWVEAVEDGSYAGTMHENRQLEAVRLRLTGENADKYEIWYQVHVENLGWTHPVNNGVIAGTTGQNLQIEAIKAIIVPAGQVPNTGWESYGS